MIRPYEGQFAEVARIFHDAVHRTAAVAYSAEQRDAWSPALDVGRWRTRCELKRPWVWCEEGRVCGFLEFDVLPATDQDGGTTTGHVDCHYVHPDYGRRGIGGRLLAHALRLADQFGLAHVDSEASHVARPLYERHGFRTICPNIVTRNGVTLNNWKMRRGGEDPDAAAIQPVDLLADVSASLPEELTQILARGAGVRVERIVSTGHASPLDFWYEQSEHEWCLLVQGAAVLSIEGRPSVRLDVGDHLLLPAGLRHRVDWTSPDTATVWLAVFWPA